MHIFSDITFIDELGNIKFVDPLYS